MSRFENTVTGVVVSVDDAKDEKFGGKGWKAAGANEKKAAAAKKAAASKSSK